MQARLLRPDEAATWKALRLEALRLHPQSFLTSLAEAEALPLDKIAARLENGTTFGAFDGADCVGHASYLPLPHDQTRHRAEVVAFFVTAAAQGRGAADALMRAVLEATAARGLWQLELFVACANTRAIAFYERHGFRREGRLPNATIDAAGQAIDDWFYVRTDRP